MSENAKKGVLAGVIVVALLLVGVMYSRMAGADTPEVVKKIGGPVVNEKDAATAKPAGGAPAGDAGKMTDDAGG